MNILTATLLFFSTLLTATGYGATFILNEYYISLGGNELDAGLTLSGSMLGTFIGVAIVGWFSGKIGAARLGSIGALLIALGYVVLATISEISGLSVFSGFLIGVGWGGFFLAAPMALSERISDAERSIWFTKFGAFQMAGIGLSPILADFLTIQIGLSSNDFFLLVAVACVVSSAMLFAFDLFTSRLNIDKHNKVMTAWVRPIFSIAKTSAFNPIIMVMCGACVFSGLMTFQTSLIEGTALLAGYFFGTYAVTVVLSRWVFASVVGRLSVNTASYILISLMIGGILSMFFLKNWGGFQIIGAIALGIGYGLVYPLIQARAVNESSPEHRSAALTWFVLFYFIGIFGFPYIGAWIIVKFGLSLFLASITLLGLIELGMSFSNKKNDITDTQS